VPSEDRNAGMVRGIHTQAYREQRHVILHEVSPPSRLVTATSELLHEDTRAREPKPQLHQQVLPAHCKQTTSAEAV